MFQYETTMDAFSINPIENWGEGEQKSSPKPHQFFPSSFYKRRLLASKFSDF